MLVDVEDEEYLFGFAERHPETGGLSWTLSTPVVEFDEASGRARTASGRVYELGKRIWVDELDDEGRLALRVLLNDGVTENPLDRIDIAWLRARKMARYLKLEAPPYRDTVAIERFVRSYPGRYLVSCAGRQSH